MKHTQTKKSSHLREGSTKDTNPESQHDPKSEARSQDKPEGLSRQL